MKSLDFVPVDADNHYYEPHDCCTRHLEAKFRSARACHVVKNADGQDEWRFGDRPMGFHRPTRDWVLPPGAYRPFMSGKGDPSNVPKAIPSQTPAFRDRNARIATLDKQGIEATIMLPSFGVAFEDDIHDDREALLANMRAFNRYIEDDWGYAYENRIFALPLITLVDREWAIAELERVAALGARGFILRPGPVYGRSPADPHFDPFWARAEALGAMIFMHPSGVPELAARLRGNGFLTNVIGNPLETTIALSHLIFEGTLDRFPKLRLCGAHAGGFLPAYIGRFDQGCVAFPANCTN